MSIFPKQKEKKPKIWFKKILAGFFDITVLLSLKNIAMLVGHNYLQSLALLYYPLTYLKFKTTIGGILLDLKITTRHEKDEKKLILLLLLRSILLSAILFLIYLCYNYFTDNTKYILPAVISLIIIIAIFFTKENITFHDYFSKTKLIINNKKNKSLIRESLLVFVASFLMVCFLGGIIEYNSYQCRQLIKEKEYSMIIKKCQLSTKISNDPEQNYNLGLALLETKQRNKGIRYLKSAEELGKTEARIEIIRGYLIQGEYEEAREQGQDLIKDPAISMMISSSYMKKFINTKELEFLHKAHIYLYIYNKTYNENSAKTSLINKTAKKDLLNKYYPISQKYLRYIKNTLKFDEQQRNEEIGQEILSNNQ